MLATGDVLLHVAADHFCWMKAPGPVAAVVADWLLDQDAAFACSDAAPLEDTAGDGTSTGLSS